MISALKKLVPSGIRQSIRLSMHKGSTYTCPFCGYTAKDLALTGADFPVLTEKDVIGGGKRYGSCHKCGSSDRERLVYIYLKEKTDIFSSKNKSILHVAPERHLSKKMLDFGFSNYVCGDLFTEGYSYPKHVINMSILDIPFEANTFDLVICNHVLEHVPDDATCMKELSRVLKPGGIAILQVPISGNNEKTYEDFSVTDPKQRELVFGQFDHIRIYGQDYTKRLAANGFKVNRQNVSKEFAQYGLNPHEDIFVCTK